MSMSFILLLAIWISLAGLVVRRNTPLATAFKPRLATLLGIALIVGSFFFQPWVRIDFAGYLDSPKPDHMVTALPSILSLLGLDQVKGFLNAIERLTSPNGWQALLVPVINLQTRLAVIFPTLFALVVLFWLPWGATLAGGKACKIVGTVMALLSALALIGLAQAIPVLDAMTIPDRVLALLPEPLRGMPGQLPAVLLGIRLGSGPWFTFTGLCLLLVGGLIEFFGTSSTSGTGSDREETFTWPA